MIPQWLNNQNSVLRTGAAFVRAKGNSIGYDYKRTAKMIPSQVKAYLPAIFVLIFYNCGTSCVVFVNERCSGSVIKDHVLEFHLDDRTECAVHCASMKDCIGFVLIENEPGHCKIKKGISCNSEDTKILYKVWIIIVIYMNLHMNSFLLFFQNYSLFS